MHKISFIQKRCVYNITKYNKKTVFVNKPPHLSSFDITSNILNVWKNTSKWRPFQLDFLNVVFENTTVEKIVDIKDIKLDEIETAISLQNIDFDTLRTLKGQQFDNLSLEQKILSTLYNQVINERGKEDLVDQLISYMLIHCGFSVGGFRVEPKPKWKFNVGGIKVSSVADFGAYKEKGGTKEIYLLVNENKSENSTSYLEGDCQIVGELLGSSFHNSKYIEKNECIVYCIKIIVLSVTIYSLKIQKERLYEIERQGFFNDKLSISKLNNPLNLTNNKDRETFIKSLNFIRKLS